MARERNYIGSYRLLKMVRAGSTCQIWEVMDEIENRRCALKSLQTDFQKDKEQIALLKHEYTVGRELKHPSCIEIYDFNMERGVPYVALEYFDSVNIKQKLRLSREDGKSNLPFSTSKMPEIMKQGAEGLRYLHEKGWIHRDVKPDNFLVNQDGYVKLIDFAISEKIKKGFGKFLAGKSKVAGTRSYMSPEQIRGESLDARSDVYGYGCMLFEMHCGRPPFTGGSPDNLLQKHLKAPVPSLGANCSAATNDLSDLVSSMMAKKREQRPETMKAVIEKLDSIRAYRREQ